jgi:peroxiredoxin
MNRTGAWLGLAAAGLLLLAAWPPAAPAAEPATPVMDPRAGELVRRFSDYVLARRTLRVEVTYTLKVRGDGVSQNVESRSLVVLQRPNLAAVLQQSGMIGLTLVCDGRQVTTFAPALNKYQVRPAPGKLSELARELSLAGGQPVPVVGALFAVDPGKEILEGVTSARYLGEEDLGGVRCHRARFSQEEFDWDVWIEAGERPVMRRLVPDFTRAVRRVAERAGAPLAQVKPEVVVALDKWEADMPLPAGQFVFSPPAGAQKVDSLFARPPGGTGQHELSGRRAPTFRVPLLEGGEFDLATAGKGKVVVLDFWATWCGPCRTALPILIEVTDAYRARGVVFVAVNQRETPETIRKYLKQRQLTCTVAVDRLGKVGSLYGVEGIPQTVLIDRDGRVRQVHVGLLPDLKQRLEQELEALLAETVPDSAAPPPAEAAD